MRKETGATTHLRNGFVKGSWCRFPRIGTVGGPGGKSRGRRLLMEYRTIKDNTQIAAPKTSPVAYLTIVDMIDRTCGTCAR